MNTPQFTLEVSASAVGWYGAVMATASLVVSLVNSFRDRARIKISCQRDMSVLGGPGPYDQSKTYFNVTVVNKGRRSVNITKAGLRIIGGKRKFAILSDSFSDHRRKVLTEESPVTEFLVEQDLAMLDRAWYVCVFDATGNEYRKYLHKLPTLWWLWRTLKGGNGVQQGAAVDAATTGPRH
jgi:hypothetical protein